MKLIEKIRLEKRAARYKNKFDKGGIAYAISACHKGESVFDIGCHKAAYLYFIRKQVGADGHVFAFEPQQKLYTYVSGLKQVFEWNNVTLEHLALSDKEEKVLLFIPQTKSGSSPGATIVADKNDGAMKREDIFTATLDEYCTRKNIKPAFLKIDVEGNELAVFRGGIATLAACRPKILVEIESRHVGEVKAEETFKYLTELGYKGYFLRGMEKVGLAEFTFAKYQNVSDKKNYCNNFVFE